MLSKLPTPPIPVDVTTVIRTARMLRELVLRLTHGTDEDRRGRAVTINDLVKLGLITEQQADELVKD